jgi:hypothetical protein
VCWKNHKKNKSGVLSTATMGLTVRSGNFGAVNSIAEKRQSRAVLAQSKFRIKAFNKIKAFNNIPQPQH